MTTIDNLQRLELPHSKFQQKNDLGEVDWDTLGKILSAHILGEVLCASYVDYKYGRNCEEFEPDTDWQFYYEEKGIMVLRKIQKDSPINVFMGRGVVDLPMEEVVAFLENHERRHEWDKYLLEIQELKRISETDVIIRLLLEAKHCLTKQHRELLLYERMKYIDGKYVRTTLSVDLPEFPSTKEIARAEVKPGSGFVCEPYEGRNDKTLVTQLVHINLYGLPVVIINQAMKRQPMCVYHIREVLHHSKTNKCSRSKPFSTTKVLEHSHNSLAYGKEVPVSDFLRVNCDQIEQHCSVGVDVHENDSLHKGYHPSDGQQLTTHQAEHVHGNVSEYEKASSTS